MTYFKMALAHDKVVAQKVGNVHLGNAIMIHKTIIS